MISFNDILRSEGIELDNIKLVRHKDSRSAKNRSPYLLLFSDLPALELYQRIQSKKRFKVDDFIAGFVGTPRGETLFFGLYKVHNIGIAPRGVKDPVGGHDVGGLFLYDLKISSLLSAYKKRLFVDWGKGFLSWVQNAKTNEKPVVGLDREDFQPPFPGFRKFIWNVRELDLLPENWKAILRSVKGVYALVCMETGKIYVGSAKGNDSLYGRFYEYNKNGHGGNIILKKRYKKDYQVTILEIHDSDSTIEAIEHDWIRKLMTTKFGLNSSGGAESMPDIDQTP